MAVAGEKDNRAHSAPVGRPGARFASVLAVELTARTGYQMGKSPLLTLFAVTLGAGPELLGLVVGTSTVTGLVASPMIGTLSDRYGRGRLLLVGTALFALMPFVYLFVETPEQLFLVRLVHGFATAIYGPVVAALVADLFPRRRAESMGWYRSARTASYFLGPLLGGVVLLYADARSAWGVVGILGLVTFLPALVLARQRRPTLVGPERSPSWSFGGQLRRAFTDPVLLRLGLVQTALYLGLRANSAFLPVYAISIGLNSAQVGLVLSIQVAATLLAQPAAGRLADHLGSGPMIVAGLLLVAGGLPLMVVVDDAVVLATLSVVLGLGEGLITPAINALVTELAEGRNYGSSLGMLESMDNVGKALGPVLAGLLIGALHFVGAFSVIGALLVAAAAAFWAGRPVAGELTEVGRDAA